MTAIPLASKSDPARSNLVSGERLVNCYAEAAPAGSETPFAIYRSPGLADFYVESAALSRGLFPLINVDGVDYLLSTQGSSLLQIDSDGDATVLGSVFGTGQVYYARNMKTTPQTAIVAPGSAAYLLEGSAVSEITDADLPDEVNSVGFLNGYFLFGIDDGRFFGTSINEGSSVNALDFATAEGHPDGLVRLYVFASQIFLFGTNSIELWGYDADAGNFPFSRLRNAVIPLGLAGAAAVNEVSGKLYFVDNFGIVRRVDQGYSPVRISNVDAESKINEAIRAGEEIQVWGYLDGGHEFVVVRSVSFTWIWDNATGLPHERETYRYERWQAKHYAFCFGKHLIASDISGGIFELSKTTYDEDGQDLPWKCIPPLISTFPAGAAVHELNLLFETGVGLGASGAAEDQDPKIMLRTSKDGGKTWSTERQRSIGTQGQYRKTVRFNRLGRVGRQGLMLEITCSAAVPLALIQADIVADKVAA